MFRSLVRALVRAVPLLLVCFSVAVHAAGEGPDRDAPGGGGYWSPGGQKFSIAVIPDTQYLFDEDRYDPQVLAKTFQWIIDHTREKNIVFTVQLGDIVNNGLATEFAQASQVFKILDNNGIQYAYSAGNHDINGSLYDNVRGPSPYLNYFGSNRAAQQRTYCGATPDGYNTCHIFSGGGQRFLLLALDWRASDATIAWAQSKLDEYKNVPTFITTHELIEPATDFLSDSTPLISDAGLLSDYGQTLWDRLIKSNNQIFMTLNGHFWPPARAIMKNLAGNEVFMHITNYQDRFFGGSAMMRLYEFDLAEGTVDVQTFSPYWLSLPPSARSPLGKGEVRLTDAANQFTMNINFKERFAPLVPVKPLPPVAANKVVIPGTLAYWRFEGQSGAPVPEGVLAVRDLSGNGNDLTRVTLPNGKASDMAYTQQFHAAQPSRGSLFINGNASQGGAYLRTADKAPLNAETFKNGYTFEAFVRLPEDCCGVDPWMGLISRMGTQGDLGLTNVSDVQNPLVTLSVSPSLEFQWAVQPFAQPDLVTNWSFRTPAFTWYHVALVNDGKTTSLYINGSKDVRNSHDLSVGLQTTGEFWLVGATQYGRVGQAFYGWLGDIRIVNRPLSVQEFMISRDTSGH
jgi:hypothetical protein